MFKTIANAFRDKEIRKRIFLTLLMLAIFRLGAFIPAIILSASPKNFTKSSSSFSAASW